MKYGYVTEKSYTTKIGSDNYVVYKFWNGSENVTGYEKSSSIVASKGEFISYKVDKDTFEDGAKIKSVTPITNKSAITEYDNDEYIKLADPAAAAVDTVDKDDTTVIYVDTKNVKGANGSIVVAEEKADGAYAKNVVYSFTRGKDYFDVLFVDVNNQLYQADSDDKEADVAAPTYAVSGTGLTNTSNSGALTAVSNYTLTVAAPAHVNLNAVKKGDIVNLSVVGDSSAANGTVTVTITPANGGEVITRTFTFAAGTGHNTTAQTASFTMPASAVAVAVAYNA